VPKPATRQAVMLAVKTALNIDKMGLPRRFLIPSTNPAGAKTIQSATTGALKMASSLAIMKRDSSAYKKTLSKGSFLVVKFILLSQLVSFRLTNLI
jgi:hypothetical protein